MAKNFVLYGLIGGLVCSAVLNAVLLGSATRRAVDPKPVVNTGPVRPVSAEVQAAWARLPEQDRKVFYNQFGAMREATTDDYKRLEELARHVADTAGRDPFDERSLRDSVVVYRHIQAELQQGVDEVLIGHLHEMPKDARETAARGLLTPFYQWMRPRRDADSASASPTPQASPSANRPGG